MNRLVDYGGHILAAVCCAVYCVGAGDWPFDAASFAGLF